MNQDLSKFNLKQIPSYTKKSFGKLKAFLVPLFLLFVITVNGFLIYKINHYSSQEPSSDQVAEQQNTIKRIVIDEESINRILSLEKRNIAVKSLFKDVRDNPFKGD